MESRNLEEHEKPAPTAAWRESCKKAIIPEVQGFMYVVLNTLCCFKPMWRVDMWRDGLSIHMHNDANINIIYSEYPL